MDEPLKPTMTHCDGPFLRLPSEYAYIVRQELEPGGTWRLEMSDGSVLTGMTLVSEGD